MEPVDPVKAAGAVAELARQVAKTQADGRGRDQGEDVRRRTAGHARRAARAADAVDRAAADPAGMVRVLRRLRPAVHLVGRRAVQGGRRGAGRVRQVPPRDRRRSCPTERGRAADAAPSDRDGRPTARPTPRTSTALLAEPRSEMVPRHPAATSGDRGGRRPAGGRTRRGRPRPGPAGSPPWRSSTSTSSAATARSITSCSERTSTATWPGRAAGSEPRRPAAAEGRHRHRRPADRPRGAARRAGRRDDPVHARRS